MQNPITIRHSVHPLLLSDIMVIAETDAIDGWADIVSFHKTEDPVMFKMEIIETADDPPRHHTVTGSTILLGMQRIIDLELPPPSPYASENTMSMIRAWIITSVNDDDAVMIGPDCADAIIQYALFNERVYS